MDDEESKFPDPVTPSKQGFETPVLRTPQGGVLYNPFQKDYVSRLGAPTLTPGLFATPKRRISGDDSEHSGSVFSPEIQGDHFPTEIDENPIYQVKLQQKLDAAVCFIIIHLIRKISVGNDHWCLYLILIAFNLSFRSL